MNEIAGSKNQRTSQLLGCGGEKEEEFGVSND